MATDETSQDRLHTNHPNIERLLRAIGEQQMSVKQIMDALGLKGRDNFLNLFMKPSISEGYVRLLYPRSPRHSRQKYLLTAKGLALCREIIGNR